jgi:hypothetical protein
MKKSPKQDWQDAIANFREITVEIGDDRVTWEYIGEGDSGDYNPDDPEDTPLLRFSCSRRVNDEWQELDDASYCTRLTPDEYLDNLLLAARNILETVFGTDIYKRQLEELSWLCHEDYAGVMGK